MLLAYCKQIIQNQRKTVRRAVTINVCWRKSSFELLRWNGDSSLPHPLFLSKKSGASADATGKLARYSGSLLPSSVDHIYCNDFVHELQPGVLQYDISDHHPIFLLAKTVPKQNKLTKWKRCYKQFHPEHFVMHLSTNLEENFTSNHQNRNEEFNNFFKNIQILCGPQCPINQIK